MHSLDLFSLSLAILAFVSYLFGFVLIYHWHPNTQALAKISSLHRLTFVVLNILLIRTWYELVSDQITCLTWITLGFCFAEGLIIMLNSWNCPLTEIESKLGAQYPQVSGLFFPRWLADHSFGFYTILLALMVLILLWRLMT